MLEPSHESKVAPWRRSPVALLAFLAVTITALALAIAGFQIDPTFGVGGSQSVSADYAGVAGPTARIGQVAPTFVLASLDGPDFDLSAEIGQNPVWITFWASWCAPCRAEAPDLEATTRVWKEPMSSTWPYLSANPRTSSAITSNPADTPGGRSSILTVKPVRPTPSAPIRPTSLSTATVPSSPSGPGC